IDARVRLVDAAQYENRVRNFDFDMIVGGWGQSESPGNEQRNYWTSRAADTPGSRNLAGIKNPAVDALVDMVIAAPTREELIARTRALDRVLLWGHYVIPNWHIRFDRIAYWNKFGLPAHTPRHGTSLNYWWIDPAKERALAERRVQEPQVGEAGGRSPAVKMAVYLGLGVLLVLGFHGLRRYRRQAAE
ncbi:MAG: hypothetical protein D6826_02560, partial [Alphaproteobacteria bacterium]